MTIIRGITDPDELERYARDFNLIGIYLDYKIKLLRSLQDPVINPGHWPEEMWKEFVDRNNNYYREKMKNIWTNEFPEWIRELLSREI